MESNRPDKHATFSKNIIISDFEIFYDIRMLDVHVINVFVNNIGHPNRCTSQPTLILAGWSSEDAATITTPARDAAGI